MTGKSGDELVRARLDALFGADNRAEALLLLTEDCGPNLPVTASDNDLVRVNAAALKCSGGTLEGLVDAIALAQTDWRDLLVAAGFANYTSAHLDWLQGQDDVG